MEDFVGTRGRNINYIYFKANLKTIHIVGKKYAQITAHVAQIERTNARKKKGLKRK